MTKTIEFVEQATIANQRRLEQYKRDLEYYEKESGPLIDYGAKIFQLKHDIEHVEEIVLPNLQQIKCELEAWHLAKTGIYEGTEITGKYHDKAIKIDRRVYVEGTEQYKTFKKALEVEKDG